MEYKNKDLWVAVCPMTDLLLAEDGTWVESVALAKKWITSLGAEKAAQRADKPCDWGNVMSRAERAGSVFLRRNTMRIIQNKSKINQDKG